VCISIKINHVCNVLLAITITLMQGKNCAFALTELLMVFEQEISAYIHLHPLNQSLNNNSIAILWEASICGQLMHT